MKRVKQRTVKGLWHCDMGRAVLNRISGEGKEGNAKRNNPCKQRKDIWVKK